MSKPTLYAQFKSKDNLIAATLQDRRVQRQRSLNEYLEAAPPDSDSRVLAVFDWFAYGHAAPGVRGCPFTNAAVELPGPSHPARQVIGEYKKWRRQKLQDLAAADGLANPDWWGSTLALLVDGTNAQVVVAGDTNAIKDAKSAAATLIATGSTEPPHGIQPSRTHRNRSVHSLHEAGAGAVRFNVARG